MSAHSGVTQSTNRSVRGGSVWADRRNRKRQYRVIWNRGGFVSAVRCDDPQKGWFSDEPTFRNRMEWMRGK